MESTKLTGKDLREINFPEGKAIGVALQVMEENFSEKGKEERLTILKKLLAEPNSYLNTPKLKAIAEELVEKKGSIGKSGGM